MARLTILNDAEYNALYELPEFSIEDQLENFDLDNEDYKILGELEDSSLRISYIYPRVSIFGKTTSKI